MNYYELIVDFYDQHLRGNGWIILLLLFPVSIFLCVIQGVAGIQSQMLIILIFTLAGVSLIVACIYMRTLDLLTLGALLVGAGCLVSAYFLAFKPQSSFSLQLTARFFNRVEELESDQLVWDIRVEPQRYRPGEDGRVVISLENHSGHEIVLKSIMFATGDGFYTGFVVDYEASSLPLLKRKENLDNTISLFFGGEPIIVPARSAHRLTIPIYAHQPGDYSDHFIVYPTFDYELTEADNKDAGYDEKIQVVILPEEE